MQLAITIAGSGWSGEQAKEMFSSFDQAKREIAEQLDGEQESEPKPQIALSEEEFRKQIGETNQA